MNPSASFAHSVTALLDVPAEAAFEFLCDPLVLGKWSLGCMETEPADTKGVYRGRSLFDGGEGFFEIIADPTRFIVDYHVGGAQKRLPRISARVVPAEICALQPGQCYVTLSAWRVSDMNDARWHRLCAAHEAEILLIKAQCEARDR